MIKKIIAVFMAIMMVFGTIPIDVFASNSKEPAKFEDMPENWSRAALENAVENGLLSGVDGKIMPNEKLTRAQMATVITRAFGAKDKGNISKFSDVKASDWFYDSMSKAYKMGVIKGSNNKLNPKEPITRQEAFVMIARAFKLESADVLNKSFEDTEQISDWAKEEVYSVINNGYIQGSNGKINPKGNITRAEFAQVFYNIVKEYIQTEGTYKNFAKGNIMVSVPNVILKDLTIEGDLIIGDGVGEGDVILDSVKVRGRIVVRGGGENSIIIKGNSDISNIIVAKVDGVVSIKVQGDANVEIIYIDDESDDVNIEGQIGNLQLMASGIIVGAIDSQIKTIDIIGKNSKVIIDKDSKVENININKEAVGIKLEVVGIADKVTTQAPNTQITGKGKVSKVEVKEGGNNAKIETTNTKIQVDKGVTGVTLPPTPPSPSSSGGSSSGGTTVVSVSAISVDKTTLTLTAGGATGTITATVLPAGATNKSVTWTSSNEAVATVAGGVVTPLTAGTTTITAKTVDGGFAKTILVTVTAAPKTDAEKVATAKGNLDLGDISSIVGNMTLPTSQDEATVSWSSDNASVIANDGTVTRPTFTEGDATVTLTATITSGTASDTKEFAVTVIKAEETDAEKLTKAKANLSLGDISAIVENMTLPTTQNDATVLWASSNEGVIATDGTVVRPENSDGNATVTLTATLKVGDEETTKAFTVTVKAKAATQHTLTLTGDNISSAPGAGLVDNNASVTVTVSPAAGKQVATFTVDGVDKKADLVANKYTFTITSDTEVVVTYEDIKVTGVILDPATLNLVVGGATGTLTATVNPSDAANKAVTWSSSNEAVATVADGVVTPLSAGSTTITVTTDDGGKTATCVVTVAAESFTLIYTAGTGGTITGTSPQTVSSGGNGTTVTAVANEGYSFDKWSDDLATAERTDTSVTANITVEAQFKINEYTVTFKDHDDSVLKTQPVEHGSGATAPADPTRTGYTFTGWDKGFTSVTGDLTITAQYTKDIVPVTNIAGVPTNGTVGSEIDLTVASVAPSDATNKTIVWSVKDAGTTEVTTSNLSTGKFTPSAAGTLQLTATIINGLTESSDYTQDFTITIATAGTEADSFTATLANVSATIDMEVTAVELEAGITNLPSGATTNAAPFTPDAKGDVTKNIVITFSDSSAKTVMVTVKVERIKITEVKATSSDFGPPVFGEQANIYANLPSFTIDAGSPAYISADNTSNAYWMKKVGDKFEKYGSEPFTAGTYYFRSQVRIDGDGASKYKLASPLKVMVGEDVWLENGTPFVSDEYSYDSVFSLEYVVTAPAYASTKALANATVTVANGTSEADAKAALDKTVEVVGTKSETGTANIAWTIAGYDGDVAGNYTATGVLTLPAGWTGTAEKVTATVTVAAVDKSTLTTAISDANINKEKVLVSTDGKDVDPDNKWVTEAAMAAYTSAITTAQGVAGKADATQTEVDNAVAALATATTTFDSAKKAGGESSLASFEPVAFTQKGDVAHNNVQYADATAVIEALPKTIAVTLENSSVVNVPVTWADTDTYNAGTAADYTFTATWGTIPAGANNKNSLPAPTVKVTVEDRAKINKVVATSSITAPVYDGMIVNPTFTITEGSPAHLDSSKSWQKKIAGTWKDVTSGNFTEGIWRFRCQVRIDGEGGTTHKLASPLKVMVGEDVWLENGTPSIYDAYSFGWVYSPEYEVTAPEETELTFNMPSYSVPLTTVNNAIAPYSVASFAEGGTKPYKFSKRSGPEWINVSEAGEISGTPTTAGPNSDLVIRVTDESGAYKEITINVGKTVINPSDRIEVINVVATSTIKDPVYGEMIVNPTFTITEGSPAHLDSSKYWQKKIDGSWEDVTSGNFTEGIWRFRCQVRIDDKVFGGNDGTTHKLASPLTVTVNDTKWLNGTPSIQNTYSYGWVYSPEYEVTNP